MVIAVITLVEGERREGEIRRSVRALGGRFGAVNGQDNRAIGERELSVRRGGLGAVV